ncbi:radical SAM protein [Myxococcota bacterium]|nr:radical SAM protein [Myxococcota bacterium]
MRIAFITPPPTKPSEPGLSAGAAAGVIRRMGGDAISIDASILWHRFALLPTRLQAVLDSDAGKELRPNQKTAFVRAIRAMGEQPHALQKQKSYASRKTYTSAIAHLENALKLTALPFPDLRLGIAMVECLRPNTRPESSSWLYEVATRAGVFDDYFLKELIPKLKEENITHVGVSLSFQQQAPAAFRLGTLLREHFPEAHTILGGPLVASWKAARSDLDTEAFELFDEVLEGSDSQMAAIATALGVPDTTRAKAHDARVNYPLSVALSEAVWGDYYSPMPTVPMALGKGCYWRRCTFCPDYLHGKHEPCGTESLRDKLLEIAQRFPDGAMLHLTDSALPPDHLEYMAELIIKEKLPLQWHGFARLEADFAVPGFAQKLADGGCSMLQFGVETVSEDLLKILDKGAGAEQARWVLRATAAAGIRNQVYLLFGLPGETDKEREENLRFVQEEGAAIHALNTALLNLPKGSPMYRHPERFGITEIIPFHDVTDLSLYDDFRCGDSHPRVEARRWLSARFNKDEAVKVISRDLRAPLKANHLCFL